MSQKKSGINHLEILTYLNKSNCRECGVPTCLAFATALINGEKTFSDCPHLGQEAAEALDKKIVKRGRYEKLIELLDPLKEEVSTIDFGKVARGIGAEHKNNRPFYNFRHT